MVLTQSQSRDVKSVVDESLKTLLSDEQFLSSIAASVAKIVEENLKKTFSAINNRLLECEANMAEFEKKTTVLTETNNKLTMELDKLQQYTRRNNIRIFGVPLIEGENVDEVVLRLFNFTMKLNMRDINIIDRAHRLGKIINGKQSIMVKFISYRDRSMVLKSRRLLKGTGIYITEDLTIKRLDLFKKAQVAHGKNNVWTSDGTVWTKKEGTKAKVLTENDLQHKAELTQLGSNIASS